MLTGGGCKLYESSAMHEVTGETIRPGGFMLTDRAMDFCSFPKGARILDVGCGNGATVEYLNKKYQIKAAGVDPSEVLLELGRQRSQDLNFQQGFGEAIPFDHAEMDGVLAECTLSLMNDLDKTLQEISRVLKPEGWFIANDVYARNPEGIDDLRKLTMHSCLRGAMAKEDILAKLAAHGFEVVLWEDHTDLLKQLIFKSIMTHGSMAEFWLKSSSCTIDPQAAQAAMIKVKMGYFMLIARKKTQKPKVKQIQISDKAKEEQLERVIISDTESLCPHCLTKIPAQRIAYGQQVYLEKSCPTHGEFQALIWQGSPQCQQWVRPKVSSPLKNNFTQVEKGCPFDCGLCTDHRQQTCTALLEVTQRCNLNCAFCFADAGHPLESDPDLEVITGWYQRLLDAGGPYNIQLSGGEPTTRNDLPAIIAQGVNMGFKFIQLNTNGIRLAQEPEYARELKAAGLSSVFLQFDGTEDAIYEKLRGTALFTEKIKAIENCGQADLGVILVPTVVPGVNTHNLGEIIKFALKHLPAIRGVHFQPVSYFGRYPKAPADEDRFTLPQVISALEEQTGGLVKGENFKPPGCENALCSFHGNFLVEQDGVLKPWTKHDNGGCCPPERAEEGAHKSRGFVARNWSIANNTPNQGLNNGFISNGIQNSWDALISRLKTNSFSISGMAFQDVWNLDLERLKDCCIHVVSPEGKLIPFCAYNLTNSQGNSLYRHGR